MVRAQALGGRGAVRLHIVRALLRELDRHARSCAACAGAERRVDPLPGGGVDREVVDIRAGRSVRHFICEWESSAST